MLKNSVCCTTDKEKRFLYDTLGKKLFKTTQLYRGSVDGFTAEDFHRLCDKKGSTLTLLKPSHKKDCIGGFTTAQWDSPNSWINVRDASAVVFNLTKTKAFKVETPDKAITCKKDSGPWFSNTLGVTRQPFNEEDACYANDGSFYGA